MNDLNGVASSTSVWHKSEDYLLVTESGKQIVGKRMRIFEIKHLIHFLLAHASTHIQLCTSTSIKQLKHCYDDLAKILLHRIPVLTSKTINFVVKNN